MPQHRRAGTTARVTTTIALALTAASLTVATWTGTAGAATVHPTTPSAASKPVNTDWNSTGTSCFSPCGTH